MPVVYFTSNLRASRVSIRRSCDIVFPEHISFPLKARLAIHGALEDRTLPVPHALDDGGGSWEVMEDTSQFDEVAVFEDGQCGENAASFEKETDVGYVLALESDGDGTDGQDIDIAAEEGAEGFPAVDADLVEQQIRREALMQEVVLVHGGRAPDGWRIDRFPRADGHGACRIWNWRTGSPPTNGSRMFFVRTGKQKIRRTSTHRKGDALHGYAPQPRGEVSPLWQ